MTTLFISDLHLDEHQDERTRLFLRFLKNEASAASRLYILGDFFEYWVGDDYRSALSDRVATALRELQAGGVDVYFMGGNRDFLIGDAYAARCGMRMLEDPATILIDGRRAVLAHGDALCTDDVEHQKFRQMVRDPQWRRGFLGQRIDERLEYARRARQVSRERTATIPDAIMDVNRQAVLDLARRMDTDLIIHGHTHRPAVHPPDAGVTRIVLGDWRPEPSVLRADHHGLELIDPRV